MPFNLGARAIGLLLGLAFATTACGAATLPASLRTAQAEPDACMDALMSGSLERHPQTGLGIGTSDVEITPVEWPFGYSARMEVASVVLLNEKGVVVAREHDRVSIGGGMGGAGPIPSLWFACGPVQVESNTGG
ncbi:MAG TPA: hypothetical protein VM451_04235 [Candidatus Limnocylindria bacterium]|nr:hypothetical protein [Candidatus Limnocylindria bacterium]